MKTFEKLMKEVEQHKFDEAAKKYINRLSKHTQKVILEYFSDENIDSTEEIRVIAGFTPCMAPEIQKRLKCKNERYYSYENNSGYACNDKEKLIFSYTGEGAIYLTIYNTEEKYQYGKNKVIERYQDNN